MIMLITHIVANMKIDLENIYEKDMESLIFFHNGNNG